MIARHKNRVVHQLEHILMRHRHTLGPTRRPRRKHHIRQLLPITHHTRKTHTTPIIQIINHHHYLSPRRPPPHPFPIHDPHAHPTKIIHPPLPPHPPPQI